MNGQILLIERGGDRIDQERHVVVDDFQDRVRRLPAHLLETRIIRPDLRRFRVPLAPETPHGDGGAEQVFRLLLHQILRGHVHVELPDEALRGRGLGAFQTFAHQGDDRLDLLVFQCVGPACHRDLPPAVAARPVTSRARRLSLIVPHARDARKRLKSYGFKSRTRVVFRYPEGNRAEQPSVTSTGRDGRAGRPISHPVGCRSGRVPSAP